MLPPPWMATVSARQMDFHILGPLEVRDDRGELSLGGGKQRALLALLLIHPNESLSTDRLIDELWGEQPPPTAAKILQNYVSQLRRVVGRRPSADAGARLRAPCRAGRARRRPLQAAVRGRETGAGCRRPGARVAAAARRARAVARLAARRLRLRAVRPRRDRPARGASPERADRADRRRSRARPARRPDRRSWRRLSRSTHCRSACAGS